MAVSFDNLVKLGELLKGLIQPWLLPFQVKVKTEYQEGTQPKVLARIVEGPRTKGFLTEPSGPLLVVKIQNRSSVSLRLAGFSVLCQGAAVDLKGIKLKSDLDSPLEPGSAKAMRLKAHSLSSVLKASGQVGKVELKLVFTDQVDRKFRGSVIFDVGAFDTKTVS